MGPTPVVVTFAVRAEARPFELRLPRNAGVIVLFTGIGPRRARTAFEKSIAPLEPKLVLSCGFAGALHPQLPVGEVIFSAADVPGLADDLRRAGAQPAQFHGVQTVVSCATEKRALRAVTGADAVDMESGVLIEACRSRGIPAAIVRVISDAADEDLPLDFNRFLDAEGEMRWGRLLGTLITQPSRVRALRRFQRDLHQAAQRLAAVLTAFLALPTRAKR